MKEWGGGLPPPTQEVGCVGVWLNVIEAVLYYWHCSGGRFLAEQDGAVVGVFFPLSSSGPLNILNAH